MARDGLAHRTSATRMNSTVRLRSGIDVATAMFSRWPTHPGDHAQCVGSREVGSTFRSTVDTRHQAATAAVISASHQEPSAFRQFSNTIHRWCH